MEWDGAKHGYGFLITQFVSNEYTGAGASANSLAGVSRGIPEKGLNVQRFSIFRSAGFARKNWPDKPITFNAFHGTWQTRIGISLAINTV